MVPGSRYWWRSHCSGTYLVSLRTGRSTSFGHARSRPMVTRCHEWSGAVERGRGGESASSADKSTQLLSSREPRDRFGRDSSARLLLRTVDTCLLSRTQTLMLVSIWVPSTQHGRSSRLPPAFLHASSSLPHPSNNWMFGRQPPSSPFSILFDARHYHRY